MQASSSTSARPDADVGLAAQPPAARLARHRRADVEPVDPKLADADVEAGQDRALLGARLEPRQADEVDPLGGQAVDRQRVAEPAPRRPVERRFRARSGTRPAGRTPRTWRSLAAPKIEPSIRPIRNLQARAVSIRAMPVDDEAVARRGVEQHQRRRPAAAASAMNKANSSLSSRRFQSRRTTTVVWPSPRFVERRPRPRARTPGRARR